MPFRAIVVGLVCAAVADGAVGEERFPFTASVEVRDAAVRSGPGEDFYPTAKLSRGDEVEVYRRDPGGWFAIRPPGGSFSWVPADEIDVREDDLGEVLHHGVPSLLGSSVREDRDVSHVKLKQGEKVIILGSSRGGGDRWYKIMPPSGEFRWIHAADLGMEDGDIPREPPRRDPVEQRYAKRRDEPRPIESVFPKASPSPPKERVSDDWHAAPRETMQRLRSEDVARNTSPPSTREYEPRTGWVPPSGSALASRESSASRHGRTAGYGRSNYERPNRSVSDRASPASVADVNAALNQLNLDLSEMVCRPRERWSLNKLRGRTKDVLRQAERPGDRGAARRLLERIAQFEDVRNKSLGRAEDKLFRVSHKSESAERRPAGRRSKPKERPGPKPLPRPSEAKPKPGLLGSMDTSQYDGAGRLVPMQKRAAGDPQYLLVDKNGLTLYFVTPAPGVNLRSYRDQLVGVNGSRREDAALGKPHIMAQRVKVLSQR